ncbi:MAG: hypothetical protein F7B61_07125 [Caldisphaeraceae archaeon]|nr:hypothetical protein [Caldisphaeraceae archaeon]
MKNGITSEVDEKAEQRGMLLKEKPMQASLAAKIKKIKHEQLHYKNYVKITVIQ